MSLHYFKKYISLFSAAAIILSAAGTVCAADDTPVQAATDYKSCKNNGAVKNIAESEINVFLGAARPDGVIEWNGKGELDFEFVSDETALYCLELCWKPESSGVDISMGIKLDGKYPFSDLRETVLNRLWKNASNTPGTDSLGNEYAGEQVETGEFIRTAVRDKSGTDTKPYEFLLTAGKHTLTLVSPGQGMLIKEIKFTVPERTLPYAEISKDYDPKDNGADIIRIQGENADAKTSNSIIPKADNTDSGMTPSDSHRTKINYIGGSSWQSPGSALYWRFNVSAAGYYGFSVRYKQSELTNGESLRHLKIDGKTPFSEAEHLSFPYDPDWKYYTLKANGDNCLFYLEEGEHTLSLEVTPGELSEFFYRLSDIAEKLGDEYIKIIKITGDTPDLNRDYELFKQIPDFTETLTYCRDALLKEADSLKKFYNNKRTQFVAATENTARVLTQMLKSPYYAQQYVSDYYTNYSSLCSWLYDMTDMPLAIDEIQIVPYGKTCEKVNAGFFTDLKYGFDRFISSFSSDYEVSGGKEKNLRIWINWGQDQAAVLNSLIKDSFTPQTGINVNLEIVGTSLINGLVSGNYPDLQLRMARSEPVNLGMRGALYDLKNFKDCDSVITRFMPGSETPYVYADSLFALPDTQTYFIMFYRSDVLESLGLSVPETWNDFIYAATVIQRSNMNVYIPYTNITESGAVNQGIGSFNLFPTLMSQAGFSLYNSELTATDLNRKPVIDLFEFWTKLYSDYGILKEADFYNRFRVGTMPLGIAPYSVYMTLYSTVPEIKGRWGIAAVPGINEGEHFVSGSGTGCSVIAKSDKKEEAWEFLKWWTSAEVQKRYSNGVESILGMLGRINTSNAEAFKGLAWDGADASVLLGQWKSVKEVPEVPGSYYLTRAVDQAFWATVNGERSAKDAIAKWSAAANKEIERKIKEYD